MSNQHGTANPPHLVRRRPALRRDLFPSLVGCLVGCLAALLAVACDRSAGGRDASADTTVASTARGPVRHAADSGVTHRQAGFSALDYEIDGDRYQRWRMAQEMIDSLSNLSAPPRPPVDPDHVTEAEITRATAYLERDPRIRAALHQAGLSARDYVLTTIALDQALVASTKPTHPPYRGLPHRNTTLVAQHRDDLEHTQQAMRYRIAQHTTDTIESAGTVVAPGVPDLTARDTLGRNDTAGRGTQVIRPDTVARVEDGRPATSGGASVGVIASGTTVALSSNVRVCTNTYKAGDQFTATVTDPTAGSNGALVPAGARAVLTVTRIGRSQRVNDPVVMELGVRALSFGGQVYPVGADVTSAQVQRVRSTSAGKDAEKVIGGAVVGAIAGQILGKNTKSTVIGAAGGAAVGTAAAAATATYEGCIPNGGKIVITLRTPMSVPIAMSSR